MRRVLIALALIVATAGAALANQCPLLIKQIEDATAGKTGKHAESVAKADEAAKAINLTLKKK